MIQKFGDINLTIKKCAFIIGEHKEKGKDREYTIVDYCNKPTKYKIVLDEERNKTRDYDYYCPEHRAKVGGNHWEEENIEEGEE